MIQSCAEATSGFWLLLFTFLTNLTNKIEDAIEKFFCVFEEIFLSYLSFELDMTSIFANLSTEDLFMLFTLILLLVNSFFFWAWMLVRAAVPWDRPQPPRAAHFKSTIADMV